jgi:hypothetical protein
MSQDLSEQDSGDSREDGKRSHNQTENEKTIKVSFSSASIEELSNAIINKWESKKKEGDALTKLEKFGIASAAVFAAGTIIVMTMQYCQGDRFQAYTKDQDSTQAYREIVRDSVLDTLSKWSIHINERLASAMEVNARATKKGVESAITSAQPSIADPTFTFVYDTVYRRLPDVEDSTKIRSFKDVAFSNFKVTFKNTGPNPAYMFRISHCYYIDTIPRNECQFIPISGVATVAQTTSTVFGLPQVPATKIELAYYASKGKNLFLHIKTAYRSSERDTINNGAIYCVKFNVIKNRLMNCRDGK